MGRLSKPHQKSRPLGGDDPAAAGALHILCRRSAKTPPVDVELDRWLESADTSTVVVPPTGTSRLVLSQTHDAVSAVVMHGEGVGSAFNAAPISSSDMLKTGEELERSDLPAWAPAPPPELIHPNQRCSP